MYEVSNDGKVFSHYTGNVLKPWKDKDGYLLVGLHKDGKTKTCKVHRLVWEVFNGVIPDGMVIDHCDGNPQNNRLENLRCVTQKENCNNQVTRQRFIKAIKRRSEKPEWHEKMKKLYKSDKWRRKTTEAVRKACNKPVLQIDCNTGQVIRKWECTADAARELGLYHSHISACCRGEYGHKSAGGFIWRFFMPPALVV